MLGLLLLLPLCLVTAQESCLYGQEDPYLLFGRKTAYIFANKNIPSTRAHEVPEVSRVARAHWRGFVLSVGRPRNDTETILKFTTRPNPRALTGVDTCHGCEPAAIWLLSRHGAHNPEANEIEGLSKLADLRNNILTNYNNGKFRDTNQRICNNDLNLLQRWEWNSRITSNFAGDLTTDGYMATQQLAQAWKQKFPGLFTGNQHDYLFKFVKDKRSSNTFKAFTEGIFGAQAESLNLANENDEKQLLPYKFCPVWQRDIEGDNSTASQLSIFESKQEYKEMISNISLRLGFNYDMQKNIVLQMYQMCRYNKAWDITNISPWCAAFTREDLKRLEYAEDLDTYYKYGYGSEVNKDIGCSQVKDMMNFLEKHATDAVTPQQPRTLIQFSSAAMLLLTLTAMGAHKDIVPLTSDNYHSPHIQGRKWMTSTIAPFNANLAAVLYKCTQNGNFQVNEPYQVLFLENERPIYLEGCRVGLCDWSLVKHKYQELVKKCDLQFCNGASRLTGLAGIGLAAFILIINHVMNRI